MINFNQRIKNIEQSLGSHDEGPKRYIAVPERMTVEEWNDFIVNRDKWIVELPEKEPAGSILKLKNVRLP